MVWWGVGVLSVGRFVCGLVGSECSVSGEVCLWSGVGGFCQWWWWRGVSEGGVMFCTSGGLLVFWL